MRKIGFLFASLMLASAWVSPAQADTILFDTNGAADGGVVAIDLMDPTVGNAITTLNPDGTGTVLFQANLGTTSLENQPSNYTNCQPTCFTFTAAVDVIVTGVSADGATVTLGLDPNGDLNVFNMYAGAFGNDLTGQCFASENATCGGTLILTGEFQTFSANFTQTAAIDDLDNFGATDNYPTVDTIVGGGHFEGDILVTDFLSAWFPNLTAGSSLFIASSEQHLPYDQTNPSECFSSDAVANCNTPGVGAVGAINGQSTNSTMTQTDANVSFVNAAAVPEPASLMLLGSGLLGAAAARRRRRAAKVS